MAELTSEVCVPCREGAPTLTDEEIAELQPQAPEWKLVTEEGVRKLQRSFRFRNFAQALAFTNAVGAIAEGEGHHPRLVTEWGKVTVTWWTHKIRGLHRNDFIMSAKTDLAYREQGERVG
ncbi:MAG: 4a-hydroxytetrahydrobiopterin dehydratase [Chloroflexi bacterium]|nr:4a-hydroxytetrahydrobiopterin dehydratase [Chloroflexota bacterium]